MYLLGIVSNKLLFTEDAPRYRDPRSASPRPAGDDGHETRRSASPNGHADR
jgi:hypothetical protein